MQGTGGLFSRVRRGGAGCGSLERAAAWAKTPCFCFLRMEKFKLHNILRFAQVHYKKYDEMPKKRLTNGGGRAKVEPTSERCNKPNCFEQDTFFSQFPAHRELPGAEKADAGRKRNIPCEQPAGTGRAAPVAQRRFAPVTGQRIQALCGRGRGKVAARKRAASEVVPRKQNSAARGRWPGGV